MSSINLCDTCKNEYGNTGCLAQMHRGKWIGKITKCGEYKNRFDENKREWVSALANTSSWRTNQSIE